MTIGAYLQENAMIEFKVSDMTCGHCVATVTKAIKALDAGAEVKTDLASKTVSVESTAPAAALSKAMDQAGYPNTSI